ncbi:ligase-associated DNA damage response endonuclease PdeM [Herbaspirillum lusitanum]|uniref:Ligase-associated DNA damage response endonuclease PdeM n=1 Tax=Herbaspirillum lusitanum TaxID=213312 RepID=A0ABW9A5J7_9BURK
MTGRIHSEPDQLQTVSVGGVALTLLPQRALLWRERQLLIVADIHFGKAAAFRSGGIPVPHGTTSANLEELDSLLEQCAITHIVFLGDFLHARTARAAATLSALRRWRDRHPELQLTLVRGNHDHHAGDPPEDLRIDVVDEPLMMDGLALCHHPQLIEGAYVLAGHIHPVIRLRSGRDALRLPCFLFGERMATLPAFGAFTGGYAIEPEAEADIFICTDDRVFRYPRG